MLRNIVFSFVLVFAGNFLLAQDTIYKVNRDVVVANVQEVGTTEIRYKRFAAPDGPMYIVRKSEVWKIVYADGATETFSAPKEYISTDFTGRRWLVGVNAFDLMFGMVTMSGEYAMKKNNLSVRVPVSMGVSAYSPNAGYGDPDYYYYSRFKLFSVGLQGLLYPRAQKHLFNYYLGIAGEYGQVKSLPYYYYYPPQPVPATYWYIGMGVVNGVLIKATDRVNISIDATFGMITNDRRNFNYRPLARLGVTMAWRFGKMHPAESAPAS